MLGVNNTNCLFPLLKPATAEGYRGRLKCAEGRTRRMPDRERREAEGDVVREFSILYTFYVGILML